MTVEVSKLLSGWSNADAPCRVERRAYDAGSGLARRQQGVCGATAAQAACTGKARLKAWGASARTERTRNMKRILLTLDVLKLLSGWLNVLPCAESNGGHAMRARCGPGGGGGVRGEAAAAL